MPQHVRNRSTSFIVLHLLFLVPKIGDETSISLHGKIGNALALCNALYFNIAFGADKTLRKIGDT